MTLFYDNRMLAERAFIVCACAARLSCYMEKRKIQRRNEEKYDSRIDFSRNRDFAGKYRKYERGVAVGAVCAAGAFLLLSECSRRQRGALKGADTAGAEPFGYRYFDRRTGTYDG